MPAVGDSGASGGSGEASTQIDESGSRDAATAERVDTRELETGRSPGRKTAGGESAARAPEGGAPATTIGGYAVVESLGRGGRGEVLLARDARLERMIALKVLRADRVGSSSGTTLARRLQREARALATLVHPNVVTVHEVGVSGGRVVIAMEYVEGKPLASTRFQLARALWPSPRTRKRARALVAKALAFCSTTSGAKELCGDLQRWAAEQRIPRPR